MMRNWGIVTKIAVSASGVVLLFLLIGGFVVINFEINLVKSFQNERHTKLEQSIEARMQAEQESLHKNVKFNTQILSEISAQYLYNVDPEGMMWSLRSYMNYPEIVAINIVDEKASPLSQPGKPPKFR